MVLSPSSPRPTRRSPAPQGTVEELLKPENKDKLKAILTYHVVSGKVVAADVVKLDGKKSKPSRKPGRHQG